MRQGRFNNIPLLSLTPRFSGVRAEAANILTLLRVSVADPFLLPFAICYLPFCALLSLTACSSAKTMPAPPSVQNEIAGHLKPGKAQSVKLHYLLYLPKSYTPKSEKRWPLILFLHGSGERGTDIWKVATHGPTKNLAKDGEFPFIVVSPQCQEGRFWSNDTLLALLDE